MTSANNFFKSQFSGLYNGKNNIIPSKNCMEEEGPAGLFWPRKGSPAYTNFLQELLSGFLVALCAWIPSTAPRSPTLVTNLE